MDALISNPLWFSTRAFGTVALVLLTATVVIGIGSAGRYTPRSAARFEIAVLHRNFSILALMFLAMHLMTALADTYTPLGWISALIPFLSPYRTFWVGLGTLAFDLLLLVVATSALRLRLGLRRWKKVHYLAYAAWPAAVFHGAGTGTDTRLAPQLVLDAACVTAVVAVSWWRLYVAGPGRIGSRLCGAVATGLIPILLYGFLASGPLAPEWAHRALSRTGASVGDPNTLDPTLGPLPRTR